MSFSPAKHLVRSPEIDLDHLRHALLQTPTYAVAFAQSVARSLRDLAAARTPTQKDAIGFILETSLVVLVRQLDDARYELRYAGARLRKLDDARRFESMRVVFTMDAIERFEFDGAELTDPEDMLNVLVVFLSCGTHTKSHVLGERSVAEIKDREIDALRRSTWTTLSIDHSVLNSSVSPIRSPMYGFHMDIDSLIDESKNRDTIQHHVLHCARPPRSQFVSFLVRSREVVARRLAEHGIPASPELLFNAMIVHPIDHYMAWRQLEGLRFSFNADKSELMVFRAFMFRHLFLRGVLNPIAPNLLSTIDEPFYRDVYRDLVAIDPELAEHATACVMY